MALSPNVWLGSASWILAAARAKSEILDSRRGRGMMGKDISSCPARWAQKLSQRFDSCLEYCFWKKNPNPFKQMPPLLPANLNTALRQANYPHWPGEETEAQPGFVHPL